MIRTQYTPRKKRSLPVHFTLPHEEYPTTLKKPVLGSQLPIYPNPKPLQFFLRLQFISIPFLVLNNKPLRHQKNK